jgi:soluble lytic murein transglycosylase
LAKTIPALLCSALVALAAASGAPASPAKKKPAPKKTAASPLAAKPAPPAGTGDLAALVRSYRAAPTPALRAAVEKYAAAHARDKDGPLARLALGVVAYENKDYRVAIAELQAAAIPQLADYTGYYLAAARVESNDNAAIGKDAAAAHAGDLLSPLSGKAWLLEARARKAAGAPSGPAAAVRLLREHYAELPQPEGNITLADCYQASGDPANAADFYQRVYYQTLSGDAADRAAAALRAIEDAMGAAYPAALPQQLLRRADGILEARGYQRARVEYQSVAARTAGPEHDQARVGIGAAQFLNGDTAPACSYLRGLDLPESEADAERTYYLEECARSQADDGGMMSAVKKLGERYPKSPWRFKALVSAANRYLIANRPDDYVPLYQDAYEAFPAEPGAAGCHWKVVFHAWMGNQGNAAGLLREHLRNYPAHPSAGAALYFLGRSAERESDFGAARAAYQRLSKTLQNTYYAMQARNRLNRPEIAGAAISEKAVAFLSALALPQSQLPSLESTPATAARIERSRLLRTAGLSNLADSELRFGAQNGGQPALLAMELAGAADAPHQALRIMKNMTPDYLGLPLNAAPRQFWELLFPLPYRGELVQDARAQGLDPYFVAGLVRQESEFDPEARSHASALGLTQVRSVTGRQYARQAGVSRFTNRMLFQPAANLKIGVAILRAMLDQNGGQLEPTLASYNAGPNRAAEWLAWNTYREPAEFVESVPYTETREYIQAVLRNADMYRRLYGP